MFQEWVDIFLIPKFNAKVEEAEKQLCKRQQYVLEMTAYSNQ